MECRLLGMCACIIGQFGQWLDKAIYDIAPPTKTLNIPKLEAMDLLFLYSPVGSPFQVP